MNTEAKLAIALKALDELAKNGVCLNTKPIVPPNSTAGEKYAFFYDYMDQMDANVRNIALDALDQIMNTGVQATPTPVGETFVEKLTPLIDILTQFQSLVITGKHKDAQKLFVVISRHIAPNESQELQDLWFRIQDYGLTVQFEFNAFVNFLSRMHPKTQIVRYVKQNNC